MRQAKAACIQCLVTGLLLLLLQAGAFAQTADTTVVEHIVDSSIEATVTTYEEQDDMPRQKIVVPDVPQFRAVPDSVIRNLQKKKDFAYANDPDYWRKKEMSRDSGGSWLDWLITRPWFRYMVLTLMIGVLLFALIRIGISNRLFIFTGGKRSGDAEEDELLKKDDLAQRVQEAEAQGNYRLAVRYRYMKVLQDMDERKIISLNAQSTNWDYVNRLGGHPLKKQFLLLTRAYEYVWYGEFDLSSDQYGYLKTEFQQFENSLNQ